MSCMRVLVAFDDEHRAFREVISEAIRSLRPELEVAATLPATIRFGGRRTVCLNPGLLELLSAVDEARRLASTTSHPC